MEWAHTAEVFGTTLERLKSVHGRAVAEVELGVNRRAAAAFLSSLYRPVPPPLAPPEAFAAGLPLAASPPTATKAAKTTRGGWRQRLTHWFNDGSASADKSGEMSYHDLLHTRVSQSYNPLALDYEDVFFALTTTQRTQLELRYPQLSFAEPPEAVGGGREEWNRQFAAGHPWLNASFSCTKLRACKLVLKKMTAFVDVNTSAIAWVYFERLVLANKVHKDNRRMLLGACLSLAIKFNEDKTSTFDVLARLANMFSHEVLPKDIAEHEFAAFAALTFDLRVEEFHIMPHILALEATTAGGNAAGSVAIDVNPGPFP
ncbi:amine-terminal domain cyclin [Gregarina niphandrodes]|uniref:Amine-terminal domain cyclin n=1 Tax=Gregarina niphandrodes TaxID=110365 RepID=A0A023AZS0_GRENI|nr:amine-terminal domain cyclin [Gregarina niphandrodes]EZG43805.1 amine-terminal domain cyclin [Gregarina niphandrodes]|eukprot:XP_011133015.1 amine-terminal domain cyclin [Gregarina niphandrodes]